MIVTFLHHSCFTVEMEKRVLIFDYFRDGMVKGYHFTGVLPEFDESKAIYVFASHFHQDHFDLEILRWAEKYPNISYFIKRHSSVRPVFRAQRDFAKSEGKSDVRPSA